MSSPSPTEVFEDRVRREGKNNVNYVSVFQTAAQCDSSSCRPTGEILLLRPNTTIFSSWYVRRGDNLIATLDLFAVTGLQLTVKGRTKNLRATGNGQEIDAGSRIVASSTGRFAVEWGPETGIGVKELVRLEFSTGASASVSPFVIFRMVPSVFFDTIALPPLP